MAFFDPFPKLSGQKSFYKKSGSVIHNFIRVFSTLPKYRKMKNPISRKPSDRWKDRPYFLGPFQLLPGDGGGGGGGGGRRKDADALSNPFPAVSKTKLNKSDMYCTTITPQETSALYREQSTDLHCKIN